jgi:septum formation topological specificity factor MinE
VGVTTVARMRVPFAAQRSRISDIRPTGVYPELRESIFDVLARTVLVTDANLEFVLAPDQQAL